MTSPDMIWYTFFDCERFFTLSDTGRYLSCVHCGSRSVGNYDSERDGGYK